MEFEAKNTTGVRRGSLRVFRGFGFNCNEINRLEVFTGEDVGFREAEIKKF